MTKRLGLFAALLMVLLALSGCATLEAIMDSKTAPDKAQDAPAVAAFKFYDSWAKW